jgi:hypothetical protein
MLSLALAKLSWAQDTDPEQQKFTWQQETHDLTFILDSYGARGATQLMKVVQGPQVRVRSARPMPHHSKAHDT